MMEAFAVVASGASLGFASIPHCIGMCGGIASACSRTRGSSLTYQGARLFAYVAIGAFAGLALGPVRADPRQLEQVIINLAVNSRDAILAKGEDKGGTVTFATRRVTAADIRRMSSEIIPIGDYTALIAEGDAAVRGACDAPNAPNAAGSACKSCQAARGM